jgi:hypothetical protein
MRLLQGFSAGGEQAGANSMTLEHAPAGRRAFMTSFTLSGTQAGQILATAVFLPVAALPEHQLMTLGWRVPFWLSLVVVVVGLCRRPSTRRRRSGRRRSRARLRSVLFRDHWADLLRVVFAAFVAVVSTIAGRVHRDPSIRSRRRPSRGSASWGSAGAAHDQLRVEGDFRGLPAVVVEAFDRQPHGVFGDSVGVLADGREVDVGQVGQMAVVIADNGQFLWDVDAGASERTHEPEGAAVVARESRGGQLLVG